jgi:hypothetical protein
MSKHYWLACVFIAATAAACGDDDGGGAVAIEDFPQELAAAQCANQVECGDMPDAATCAEALVFEGNDVETLIASVQDGTIDYDDAQAGRCLDFIANQGCAFEGFYIDNPCANLFSGTLNQGDACFDAAECAGTADCEFADPNCDNTTACCPGTCGVSQTESQVGGPCDNGTNFCSADTFCKADAAGGPGTCTDPDPTPDAPCTEIDGCDSPAYCNLDFQTGMGNCTVPAGPGEDCALDELLPCADISQFCDTVALKCTDSVGPGAACDDGTGGANGATCLGFCQCTNANCVADGSIGDTCNSTTGEPDCLGTLSCSGTTCTAPAPGVACN